MTNDQHSLAMAHYENCAAEAWDEIAAAMRAMQPVYENAPNVIAAAEKLITKIKQNDHAGFYIKEVTELDTQLAFSQE